MSTVTVTQWPCIIVALLLVATLCHVGDCKVFERCELAKSLRQRHRLDLGEVANWVCIAQHSSGFNTAAQAFSATGGSHGIFQISDVYWCSPPGKGAGCNLPCHKLRDDNLSDDFSCAKRIYDEHQRISGDGYTAWNAYQQFCRDNAFSYIKDCFPGETKTSTLATSATKAYNSYQPQYSVNAITDYSPKKRGKLYGRCELAQELYHKHKMPMEQIPTWVCIAEHESRFDTAAVGRLNADGSADHGLFQISDLYWCSHDHYSGGKACGLSCSKLLDEDITDDVRCVKKIHNEHTAISGDGFNAWTVYRPYCQNQRYEQIANCFKNTQSIHHQHQHQHKTQTNLNSINNNNPFLKNTVQHSPTKSHHTSSTYNDIFKASSTTNSASSRVPHKGKVYTRCSLAQELYFKHNFPMQDISTWVCIAEHESQFNTAAIGRLNTDGSADHGLFQISDKYWCTHDAYGGKACNLPCDKLLDDDLRDDVQCIRTIHDEHTRISGDGFNAWTVYKPHCQNRNIDYIESCFDKKTLESNEVLKQKPSYDVSVSKGKGKIYSKCELAQELYNKHRMPMDQIPKWVCIAKYESSFNTAAVGRLNTDGSADHGLFQISDLYWCTHDRSGGKACNLACDKLLDSDITDDIQCIKIIHEEHTRISGDGFNAWTVYQPHCRNSGINHVKDCFTEQELKQASNSNSLVSHSTTSSKTSKKGKIYKKCELAQELYHKHRMPMEQIPKWVCIAQHESSYNTAAVGRLNTDGSADHGIFQISDLYWCTHDQQGGKACNIPCHKLLDSDISDDVRCIKIIYEEHTRISGDGFNAWTVYKPHCRTTGISHVEDCFTEQELKDYNKTSNAVIESSIRPDYTIGTKNIPKGKIYNKCELAKELLTKHRMPMEQIPTWVCIAQHESSFNTAAVGRLNTDGSADHGLFQISDLYWCTHDEYGGKACNIPCDKLLDSDITDDVRCIKIIYEEHTRISGDGFNAWTVYKPHCHNRKLEEIRSCFSPNQIEQFDKQASSYKTTNNQPSDSSYSHNPFLLGVNPQTTNKHNQKQSNKQDSKFNVNIDKPNYTNNPFLQNIKTSAGSKQQHTTLKPTNNLNAAVKQDYKQNPFLNGSLKSSETTLQTDKEKESNAKLSYNHNPFLSGAFTSSTKEAIISKPTELRDTEAYKPSPTVNPFNSFNKTATTTYKYENKYLNSNDFRTTTLKPITQSATKYINSNDFRITTTLKPIIKTEARTTTQKPITSWNVYTTTTRKPITITSDKIAITTTKPFLTATSNTYSATTTKKPNTITTIRTTATTVTRKPSTTLTAKRPNTVFKTTTKMPLIITPTTSSTKIATNWNWRTTTIRPTQTIATIKWNQKYTNNATIPQTVTHLNNYKPAVTTPKPELTTWNWQSDGKLKTTKKPSLTQTLTAKTSTNTRKPTPTTVSWQKYVTTTTKTTATKASSTTITAKPSTKTTTTRKPTRTIKNTASTTTRAKPSTKTTTTRKPSTTTTNWQKYEKTATIKNTASTTTTTKPSTKTTTTRNPSPTTASWQKYFTTTTKTTPKKTTSTTTTTKPSTKTTASTKSTTTTTRKPTTTTATWQKYDKTTTKTTTKKTTATTTTTKPSTKSTTTRNPTTTTASWQKYDKTTTKTTTKKTNKPSSTTTTPKSTFKPNTARTTKLSITTTTKKPTIAFKTTTSIPRTAPTTLKNTVTTTKQKPSTTTSQYPTDYDKYKKDPFSHPFFSKVNEQLKQLRGNNTTTKQPIFTASKLQSFPQSPLYQDFKNSLANKTKTIVSYKFGEAKLTTTKPPRF